MPPYDPVHVGCLLYWHRDTPERVAHLYDCDNIRVNLRQLAQTRESSNDSTRHLCFCQFLLLATEDEDKRRDLRRALPEVPLLGGQPGDKDQSETDHDSNDTDEDMDDGHPPVGEPTENPDEATQNPWSTIMDISATDESTPDVILPIVDSGNESDCRSTDRQQSRSSLSPGPQVRKTIRSRRD